MSQQLGLGVQGKPKEKVGENLDPTDLDTFKEDQIVQLYELMKAAKLVEDNHTIGNHNKTPELIHKDDKKIT